MTKTALTFATLMLLAAPAQADLNSFLRRLNVQTQADLGGFSLKISTQFNVPVPQVEAMIQQVAKPADVFMVYQVAQMAAKPSETALQTYQANRTKGWGAIAKEMGIKPGSAEFHNLKSGNLTLSGTRSGASASAAPAPAGNPPVAQAAPGKGKGKGKNWRTTAAEYMARLLRWIGEDPESFTPALSPAF